jgi:hypothetical protein
MMQNQIAEADWKILSRLKPVALERFCKGVLSEVIQLASEEAKGSHACYLELYKLIQERDDELASAFDEMKRSKAYILLARMRGLGIVTDEEFAAFSSQTQTMVALFQPT